MLRIALIFSVLVLSPLTTALAAADRALLQLDPEERAHQACIIRGIEALRRDKALPGADRIKTGVVKPAEFTGTQVTATGGAVRSRKNWYRFAFKCAVTEDQMKATSFTYEIGTKIPEDKWEDYGLWR